MMEHSYIAGVIDSDGSISITRRTNRNGKGYKQYAILVQITWAKTNESYKVLNKLKKMYDGGLYLVQSSGYSNNKFYRYTLESRKCIKLLIDIIPFLRIKKNQAKLALKFIKFKTRKDFRGIGHTKKDWNDEDKFHKQMLYLNKKGSGN